MKKVQIGARIDSELKEIAEKAAKSENRSLSNLIETLTKAYLIEKGYINEAV